MKAKKGIVVGLCCAATIISAQNTLTLGIFGFSKVDKPAGTLNLAGNNFGDSASTLNEVCPVEQFNGAVNFSQADRVIVWNSSTQAYETYALYDDSANNGTTLEWRDADDFSGSAVNPFIPAGSGFWIQSMGTTVGTNLVISGDTVDAEATTNQIVAGLQLISYPFSTTIDLNATQLKDNASGATSSSQADQVFTWNVAAQTFITYALYDDSAYGGTTLEWRDANNFNTSAGAIPLTLGRGFWLYAQNTFTWAETNQYYGNL